MLDADTVEWFRENGGLPRANGDAFRARLLSRGGSLDPMEAFRDLRGRDPLIDPLLARRGLLGAAANRRLSAAGGRYGGRHARTHPASGTPGSD